MSAHRRDDTGTTLVELLVSSVVIAVVLVTVALALLGMTRSAAAIDASAVAAGQARTLTALVTRSLSSASAVNAPVTVGTDVYLEALTLPDPGGTTARCVQWRVRRAARLVEVRSWPAGTTSVSAWSTVADGVVDVPAVAPFAVLPADADWANARVVIDVSLQRSVGTVAVASAVVPLVNGVGPSGGLATDPVCTEAGRS